MKKLFSLLFAAMLSTQVWAQTFTVDGLKYTVIEGTTNVSVEQGSNTPTNPLTIPSTVTNGSTTYTVTTISDQGFRDNNEIVSVIIPNSVTTILSNAFRHCKELSSVTIPSSVTTIGEGPFCETNNLTAINVDNGNTKFISVDGVLYSADMKRLIQYPCNKADASFAIPYGVESIEYMAFSSCKNLTSLTLPNSLKIIKWWAIAGCGPLKSIVIPESVKSIGSSAFYGCSSLNSVTIPNSVTSIGSSTFYGCSSLNSVTIPNSVKSIGNSAFYDCSGLSTIIPNSVTSIGNDAFSNVNAIVYTGNLSGKPWGAKNLGTTFDDDGFLYTNSGRTRLIGYTGKAKGITIPETVTSISNYAFRNCRGLTSVTIHNSVTSIGFNAFYNCNNATLYCQATSIPSGWNSSWTNINSSYIKWGCNVVKLVVTNATLGTATGTGYAVKTTDGSMWYLNNAQVTLIASPNSGYHTKWKNNSTENVITFNATESKIYTVTFEAHTEEADAAVAATCTTTGKTAGKHCSVCNAILVPQTTTSALGHNYGTPTYTWSNDGKSCSAKAVCSRNQNHTETEAATITSAVAAAATCENKGKTKYTATFTNSRFSTQTKTVTDIAALGHNYGSPTYTWSNDGKSCSAKAVCSRNQNHTETEDATITSAVTTAATCESKGKTKYTATFTNSRFSTQTKTVTDIAALGHNYGTPTYTWSNDGKSCSAKAVCSRNQNHTETENATITSVVTTAAACESKGKTKYTATFTNSRFSTQTKTVTDIAALGHDYGSPSYTWSNDGKSCSATAVCSRNQNHTETENATISSAVATAATCEDMGSTTYTASFTNGRFSTQTKTVTDIVALGHDYGTPKYTWSVDGKTCVAKVICSHNESHTITENGKITDKVTTAATCENKGKTKYTATFTNSRFSTQTKTIADISALGHSYGSPTYEWNADNSTCTATKICANDNSHVVTETANSSSVVTKAATCEEIGTKTFTAVFTKEGFENQQKTEEIAALQHNYGTPTYEWSTDNSTCTAKKVCANDNSHVVTETVNSTSAITVAATCEEVGSKTYTAVFTKEGFEDQQTIEEIAALQHNYGSPTYEWSTDNSTCTAKKVCANDNTHVVTETVNSTSAITVAATCEEVGTKNHTAVFTKEGFEDQQTTEEIAALQHNYGSPTYEWSTDNSTCTATKVCANDNFHVVTETIDATSEVIVAATCEGIGTKTITAEFTGEGFETQQKTEEVAAIGHTAAKAVAENYKAPTCTIAGSVDSVVYCSTCQSELNKKNVEIAALGHAEVVDAAIAPSCTEAGKTVGKHCSVCEAVLVAQEDIPALNHDWGEWQTQSESTCSTQGSQVRVCSRDASHTESQNLPLNVDNHENIVTDEAVAPTCTETGKTEGKHCSVCDAVLVEQEEIAATGHTPAEAVAENYKAPTCTAVGSVDSVVYCTICQSELSNKTVEIAALGHTEVVDAAVVSSCTTAGKTEGKHCSVCNAILVAQEEIAATGHNEIVDAAVAATCTEAGKTEGKHCSVCNTVLVAQQEVAALGHKEVVDAAVAATCTEAGKTEGKHCSVCNAVLVAQEEIAALGHTEVVDAAVAATCTEAGKTEGKHCSVCNTVLVAQQEVAALGHTEVIDAAVAATCTEAGKTEGKHCSVCNEVLVAQEIVAALGHTEVTDVAVAATCTESGLTEGKHCSVCNAVLVAQETIPALGHEFKTYVFNNDATTEADGTETALCEHGCGAKDTRTAEGTKIVKTPEDGGVAIGDEAANTLNIYAHHNIIVVENAADEIRVYDATGRLICKDIAHNAFTEFRMNTTGIFIVKTGNTTKRVAIMD